MLANAFVDNAKVMAKGQVTIPKDVREVLGVASGDCQARHIELIRVENCYARRYQHIKGVLEAYFKVRR